MFKTHREYSLSTGVKNNTIAVIANEEQTTVIYHKTIVFKSVLKDIVQLDNGGYDTISTRAVINTALSQFPGFQNYKLERKKGITLLNGKPFLGRATLLSEELSQARKEFFNA